MHGFVESKLHLSLPREGVIRTTLTNLTYYSETTGWIVVEKGLKTDLGSIPRPLQIIFPKDGLAVFAYVLHDYLYKIGKYSRTECDDVLEEAMDSLGVGYGTRKSVRLGLMVGGSFAWNEHRKNEVVEEATYN